MGGGAAFCTGELKVKPALALLDVLDPDGEAVCYVGIRREESRNRANFPQWTEESEKHGGRSLEAPLVTYTTSMRDELIKAAGFDVLPHRSKECSPCVHANKRDLLALDEADIAKVERIEAELGINSKGNHRTLFRPKRHKGAVGIRAVMAWAKGNQEELELTGGCDSGYCGS